MSDDDESRSWLSPEQQARWNYSNTHPAFQGTAEFDLSFEILGQRFVRKARVNFTSTPGWEYYDLHKKAPYVGWEASAVGFSLFTAPEEDGSPSPSDEKNNHENLDEVAEPSWIEFGLAEPGVLPDSVWDAIYDLVDETCRAEDAKRRTAALQSAEADPTPKVETPSGPLSKDDLDSELLSAMQAAGTPPEIIFAFKRTGRLLTEASQAEPEAWDEWNSAIREYFAMERERSGDTKPITAMASFGDGPPPTEIPALLARPLTEEEFEQVVETLTAIDSTLDRPVSLISRVEMAAAMLALVLSSAAEIPAEEGEDRQERIDFFEDLTVERARELADRDLL